MATEPARTIGSAFADAATVKAFIGAVVAILVILGVQVAPGIEDQIVTIITVLVPVIAGFAARQTMANQATAQAERTREVVYSPASTARIAKEAAATGDTSVPPPPADR